MKTPIVIVDVKGQWCYDEGALNRQEKNRKAYAQIKHLDVDWEEFEEGSSTHNFEQTGLVLTTEEFAKLLSNKVEFSNVRYKEIEVESKAITNFKTLEDKVTKLLEQGTALSFNDKCDVHIPGHALATYNETMLMEDACTDAMQSEMDKGWRIIAACPQPDQRRPDYILGRYNPNIANKDSAERV